MLLVSETASNQPGNDATVLLKDIIYTWLSPLLCWCGIRPTPKMLIASKSKL